MDEATEDDKKPFDAEAGHEDDTQPDPDEHLMLDQGNGRVWLVKVRYQVILSMSLPAHSSCLGCARLQSRSPNT